MSRVMVLFGLCVVLSACGGESAKPGAMMGRADMAPDLGRLTDAGRDMLEQGVDQGEMGAQDMAPAYPDPKIYEACAPYAVRGPYAVGVTTLMVDGAAVEVWYPAPKGAEASLDPDVYDLRDWLPDDFRAKIPESEPTRYVTSAWRGLPFAQSGPVPLVLFSHGFAGYRLQSSELTAHVASWGFVVASAEHPERNLGAVLSGDLGGVASLASVEVLRQVYAAMQVEQTREGGFFEGRLDLERVGLMGHSAGGRTAIYTAPEEFVDAVVGLAPAVAGFGADDQAPVQALVKPTLFILGSRDAITREASIRSYYQEQPLMSRAYLSVEGAGHLAFSDICVIGRERGGVAQLAVDNGVLVPTALRVLSQDGCKARDLLPERAWPMIHHFSVSYLRHQLGVDEVAVGFGQEAAQCFGEMTRSFEPAPL